MKTGSFEENMNIGKLSRNEWVSEQGIGINGKTEKARLEVWAGVEGKQTNNLLDAPMTLLLFDLTKTTTTDVDETDRLGSGKGILG